MRVVHPTGNANERVMYQTEDAGFFESADIPPIEPCLIHLGALTDSEFTLGFMRDLKQRGFRLSVDMQSFVRQVDPESGMIHFRDVPDKREIVGLADIVKLDIVEAEILMGMRNLEEAVALVEEWGAIETILTCSDGVFARYKGDTLLRNSPTGTLKEEPVVVIPSWERIWLGGSIMTFKCHWALPQPWLPSKWRLLAPFEVLSKMYWRE